MSQEPLDIPTEWWLDWSGLPVRLKWHGFSGPLTRKMSAETMPFDCARMVFAAPSGGSSRWRRDMMKQAKNTICLWYDGDAEDAARFYAKTFPDSSVGAVHLAPGDFPSGKKGDVLTVDFTVMGIPCLGLNGGPTFKHSEAFSFQVATAEDRKSV